MINKIHDKYKNISLIDVEDVENYGSNDFEDDVICK